MLAGNPGKRPLPTNEPKVGPISAGPPGHLTAAAVAEWRRVTAVASWISDADAVALALYCQYYADWVAAREMLARDGEVIVGANGSERRNPWSQVAKEAATFVRYYAIELGITPSARTRVQALDDAADKGSIKAFAKRKGA